jgi:catechol 2,3-dioxygenase
LNIFIYFYFFENIDNIEYMTFEPDGRPQLSHLGIYTDHQDEMQAFYEQVLGLVVSDTGVAQKFKRRIVFMTSDPRQHHQFVLVARQEGDPPRGPLFQASFKVHSLDALRTARRRALAMGVNDFRPMNHGNSWSLYFSDPEGNTVEVYMDTPWYVAQPFADELDLSLPDTEIHRLTEARLGEQDTAMAAAHWSERMAARLQSNPYPS